MNLINRFILTFCLLCSFGHFSASYASTDLLTNVKNISSAEYCSKLLTGLFSNQVSVLSFANGEKKIFKSADGERASLSRLVSSQPHAQTLHEVAAFIVANKLQFKYVPKAELVKVDGKPGVLIDFVKGRKFIAALRDVPPLEWRELLANYLEPDAIEDFMLRRTFLLRKYSKLF